MGLVFPGGAVVKNLPAKRETQETWGLQESLEERTATHSSISAWKIPWTEESDGLQSVGSQRVGHDWANEHTFVGLFCPQISSGQYTACITANSTWMLCYYRDMISTHIF